jgi:nicotinate-nucleotide--dimethylbenzimidazole phosphoribosyltransferase
VSSFQEALGRMGRPDQSAMALTADHLDRLTKPRHSLGRLESVAVQLAGIAGESPPPVPDPATVVVFAGDHGVLAEGVTPWPAEVTAQMVANFCAGGAAINVLARQAAAGVVVVDVGVAADLPAAPGLVQAKVRAGTANLAVGPAMSRDDAAAALDVGATVAADVVGDGARCLITGDMGIGNTTPSAALVAHFTGRPAAAVTGRGTGIGDEEWERKCTAIERGLDRTASEVGTDPLSVLASLGGLEIAALAGFVVGGAAARRPVVVDGVIAVAATLVAEVLAPGCAAFCIAGHRSTEPGASAGLEHLGLVPLLDLDLRLGEGTGACLALPVLQAGARVVREMATFDSAGVTEKTAGGGAGGPRG